MLAVASAAVAKTARTETFMILVGERQRWPLEREQAQHLVGKYDGDNR
jgi:hypothetical protein